MQRIENRRASYPTLRGAESKIVHHPRRAAAGELQLPSPPGTGRRPKVTCVRPGSSTRCCLPRSTLVQRLHFHQPLRLAHRHGGRHAQQAGLPMTSETPNTDRGGSAPGTLEFKVRASSYTRSPLARARRVVYRKLTCTGGPVSPLGAGLGYSVHLQRLRTRDSCLIRTSRQSRRGGSRLRILV